MALRYRRHEAHSLNWPCRYLISFLSHTIILSFDSRSLFANAVQRHIAVSLRFTVCDIRSTSPEDIYISASHSISRILNAASRAHHRKGQGCDLLQVTDGRQQVVTCLLTYRTSLSSDSVEMQSEYDQILQSLSYDGIRISKLQLTSFPNTDRGLGTTSAVKKNEILLTIPNRHLMNLKVIGQEFGFDWRK